MKTRLLLFFAVIFLTAQAFSAQTKMKTIEEKEGGFSYSVPASWSIGQIEGMQFQIARDKPVNGFAANINVLQEKNNYKFDDYVKLNIKQLTEYMSDYKELDTDNFTTSAGLKGKRHICSDKQVGKNLIQVFYFLEGKDKTKTIVTGSCLAETRDKYVPLFDEIAKSFKVIK